VEKVKVKGLAEVGMPLYRHPEQAWQELMKAMDQHQGHQVPQCYRLVEYQARECQRRHHHQVFLSSRSLA
jgi:PHP family Zn ribbon phosphoesterase